MGNILTIYLDCAVVAASPVFARAWRPVYQPPWTKRGKTGSFSIWPPASPGRPRS
jgi:hypothetical protein